MATTYYNDLQKLYVAYFNRPADTAGLAYWEGVVEAAKGNTAAVSASFAASAEYKAAYAGMSNADIVNQVYLNLFGRAAEQAGKDYWAGLLDNKKITIDAVVTQVAGGAQGSDLQAFNNKVAASTAFTAALGTTNAYSGDKANAVAKLFLSSVTDNGSFAAATDTYALGATVAKVNAAGTTFSLQSGLSALDVANSAKAAFLAAADGDNDATTSTTDAAITANVATKAAAVGTIINAVDTDVANAGTVYTNVNTSAAVKSALVTEAQANLAANLTAANTALSTANTNVAKVAGLSDAIAALASAKTAATAAASADASAHTDVQLKVAAYNVLNTTALAPTDYNYATVVAALTAANLITVSSSGALSLATGVTETNHQGITALLASLTAEKAADTALTSANTAKTNAQTAVDFLDLNATAKTDLTAIANAMTIVKLAAGTTPTQAQITTEQSSLHAIYLSDKAISDASGLAADAAVTAAAKTADDNFTALVNTFNTDAAAGGDPLASAQVTATGNVKTAQDAITALNKALADLATATNVQTQLNSVTSQVNAAKQAFTDNSLLQPVTLDATHASNVATAGADIYVAGKTNASITNFGLLGADSLYLGSKYTLNTTGDITKGNDAVLEAFIIKSGSDTKIVLEQKAFASSEAGGLAAPDLVTITLTGVDSTKVHLTNGIITVS